MKSVNHYLRTRYAFKSGVREVQKVLEQRELPLTQEQIDVVEFIIEHHSTTWANSKVVEDLIEDQERADRKKRHNEWIDRLDNPQ